MTSENDSKFDDLSDRLEETIKVINKLIEGNNTNGQAVLDVIKAVGELRINFSLLVGYLGAIEAIEIDKFELMKEQASKNIRKARFEELFKMEE